MLSLQLKSGEYITIGEEIAVQVFEQPGSSFRVAVKAPREIPVLRGEVHERTNLRPEGLLKKRPKSPSEVKHNAKHFEEWAGKQEQRKQAEAEKAAAVRELMAIARQIDALAARGGDMAARQRLSELRLRLAEIAAAQAAGDTDATGA